MRRERHPPVRLHPTRVTATLIAIALAATATAAGCGSGSPAPRRTTARRATQSPAKTTTAPAALTATTPTASTPTTAAPGRPPLGGLHQLTVELDQDFVRAGAESGGYLYDMTTGTQVFSLRAERKRPPASVEKLFTSIAALRELGPRARFQTAVLGRGHLGSGGVWRGSLYLRGGGDPTFGSSGFNQIYEHGYGPTVTQLAAQLKHDGIRRVTGKIIGDGSLFDYRPGVPSSNFAPDLGDIGGELGALTYDHGMSSKLDPAAFAAHEVALALRADHVFALAATKPGRAPAQTTPLARVSSPPLSTLLELMNVPSDDFFAEVLAKQLGARFGGAGTTAAGASVIENVLQSDYNLHPKVIDGSGLSPDERTSPLEVVDLLRDVYHTGPGNVLWNSLPTVGLQGTVQEIADGTPAQGHCVAKTGTLNTVTNLAGYCHSAGGQLVAFALFIDKLYNWQALPLLGKMVASIARRNPSDP